MIWSSAAIFATAALAYVRALPVQMGAHPFWATQVLAIGAIAGVVLNLTPFARNTLKLMAFSAIAAAAFGLAHYGKTQFAASFAEDARAGQIWFLGWHVFAALALAAVGAIVRIALVPRS